MVTRSDEPMLLADQTAPQDPPPQDPPREFWKLTDRPDYQEVIRRRVDQEEQEEEKRFLSSFRTAMTADPDMAAEAREIGKKLGVAPELVGANPDVAREVVKVRAVQYQELRRQYPTLLRQLDRPDFATIAHDDIDNLKVQETVLGELSAGLDVGAMTNERGYLGVRKALGWATQPELDRLVEIDAAMAARPSPGFVGTVFETVGQMVGTVPLAMAAGTATAMPALAAGPASPVAVPTAFMVGAGAAMFSQSALIEGGNAYLDYIEQGYDKEQAAVAAFGVGLMNGALELIGAKYVAKPFAAIITKQAAKELAQGVAGGAARSAFSTFIRDYAKGLAGEVSTEVLQEAVTIAGDEFARATGSDQLSRFERATGLSEIAGRLGEVFSKTAQSMAVLALPGPGLRAIVDTARAERAKQQAQTFERLVKALADSKVAQRSPDATEQFIADKLDGTQAEDIYVDAERFAEVLQQPGMDRAKLAEIAPDIARQLDTAAATGGDVVIPTAEYIARIAKQLPELHAALHPHLRIGDPDAMSLAQSEETLQQPGRSEEIGKQAEAQRRTDEAFAESARQVEQRFAEMLRTAGVDFTREQIGHGVKGVREMFAVLAQRLGTTPEAVLQMFPVKVQGPATVTAEKVATDYDTVPFQPGLPDTLEQPGKATETPEFKAWFGESKVVDKEGKPLRMFHGTSRAGFESFETYGSNYGLAGTGSYFTESPEVASSYTKKGRGESPAVYPVFLRIKNPIDLDAPADVAKWAEAFPGIEDFHEGGEANESWFRAAEAQMRNEEVLADEAGTIMQEKLLAMGFDGLTHMGGGRITSDSQRHRVYVALDPEQVKSATGNRGTFDPNDPNILHSGPRGDFNPRTWLIRLSADASLDTFLHEMSHVFVAIYADLAAQPNAPPLIVQDFQALLDWFGVKDVQAWHAMTLGEQRRHHEAFAFRFEEYLFTGEAPTPELRPIFQRFREWIGRVYRWLVGATLEESYRKEFGRELPKLSKEVRQVMDRMFASEQAAARAEAVRGLMPAFQTREEAAKAGLDDAEWERLQAEQEQVRQVLAETLTKESLQALTWTRNARSKKLRQLQRERRKDRDALREEVAAEVQGEGVYRARKWLQTGRMPAPDGGTQQGDRDPNHRLSTAEVRRILGDEAAAKLSPVTSKDGVRPDDIAPAFGFETGEQLVKALADAPKLDEAIEQRTDALAEQRVGQIDEAAVDRAMMTEARARFLAVQVRALERLRRPVRETQQAARAIALRLLEQKTLRELRPAQFAAASRRASLAARDAVAKGDMEEAHNAARASLVQHYLGLEARQALQEWEAAKRKFRALHRPDARLSKSRDVNLVGAARAILAAYGLGEGPTQAQPHLEKVAEYDAALYEELRPMVDRATQGARDHRTMPLAEFRDLRDAVLSLWERSLRERMVEFGGKKEARDEVAEKLLAAFERFGIPEEAARRGALTKAQERQRAFGSAKAAARHVESWALEVDGGKPGDIHRYLYDLIRKPFDSYLLERNKTERALFEQVAGMNWSGGKIHSDTLDYTFRDLEHLLGFVLHLGNDSNARINGVGRGWAEDLPDGSLDASRMWNAVHKLVAQGALRREHMDLVQFVWDSYEGLKARAQQAFFENYGYYFEELEARAFTLRWPDGTTTTYRGGYVPAKPDLDLLPPDPGQRTKDSITETGRAVQEARATTGKGFTITRTGTVRPLEMSVKRQLLHYDEELRFIYLQRPGRDLDALLRDKRVRSAIHRIDPNALSEMFDPWLLDTLKNRVMAPGGNPAVNKLLVMLRKNTALAYMFGNVANALQQVTGLATSALYVKPRHLRAAASLLLRERGDLVAKILQQSEFMRLRIDQQVGQLVDDMDVALDPTWVGKAQAWTQRHAYFLQRWMQNPVDLITWQGGFEQAIAEGRAEADAIRDADSAVRRSQGSGTAPDISKFERGSASVRILTQFGSFWFAMFNTLAQRHGAERAKAAAVIVLLAGVAAGAIKKALEGGWDDDDEDGVLWDDVAGWTFGEMAQSGAAAAVPVIGPAVMRALVGESGGRLSLGASWGAAESAAHALTGMVRVWTDAEKDFAGKNVRDIATLVTLVLGLPVTLPARPASYGLDVGRGEVRPTGPIDLVRGLITGRASAASTR